MNRKNCRVALIRFFMCFIHSYSLSGGHGQFSINPSTGQIITSSLLDREDRANYKLLVVATDGGQPQGLSSSATVSVTVADINDNPPRFHHHPYVTHIPTSTAAGVFNIQCLFSPKKLCVSCAEIILKLFCACRISGLCCYGY